MQRSDLPMNTVGVSIHRKENIDPEMEADMSISFSGAVVSTQNPEKKKSSGFSSSYENSTLSQHDSGVKMTPSDSSFQDHDSSTSSPAEPVMREKKGERKHISDYSIDMDDTFSECFKVPKPIPNDTIRGKASESTVDTMNESSLSECFKVNDEKLTKKEHKRKRISEYSIESNDSYSSCFKVPNQVKKDKFSRKGIFDCTNDVSHMSDCFKIEDEPQTETPKRKGALNYTTNVSTLSDCFKPEKENTQKEKPKRKGALEYTINASTMSECFKSEATEPMQKKPKRKGMLDFANESSDNMSECFKPEESEKEKLKRKRLLDYTTEYTSISACFNIHEIQSKPEKLKRKRLTEYTNESEDNMSSCFRTDGVESQTPTNEHQPILNQTYSIAVNTPNVKVDDEPVTLFAPLTPSTAENKTFGSQSDQNIDQSVSVQSTVDVSDIEETLVPPNESHFTYEISLEKDDTRVTSLTPSNVGSEMDITLTPINSIDETDRSTKSNNCATENSNETESSPKLNDCNNVDSHNKSGSDLKSNNCTGVNLNNEIVAAKSNDSTDRNSINDDQVDESDQSHSIVRESVYINSSHEFSTSKILQVDKSATVGENFSECVVSASASSYSVVVVGMEELDVPEVDKNTSPVNVEMLSLLPVDMSPVKCDNFNFGLPNGTDSTEPSKEQIQELSVKSNQAAEDVMSVEEESLPQATVECAESANLEEKNIFTEILPPPATFANASFAEPNEVQDQTDIEPEQRTRDVSFEVPPPATIANASFAEPNKVQDQADIESEQGTHAVLFEVPPSATLANSSFVEPNKVQDQVDIEPEQGTHAVPFEVPPTVTFADSSFVEPNKVQDQVDIEPEQGTHAVPFEEPITDIIPPPEDPLLPRADGAASITVILPPPSMFANASCATPDVLPSTPANNTDNSNLLKTPATAESLTPQIRRSTRSRKSADTDSDKSGSMSGRASRKRSFNSALSTYSLRSRPSVSSEGSQQSGGTTKSSTTMFSMSRIGRVPVESTVLSPEIKPQPKKKRTRAKKDDSQSLKSLPSKPNFPKFDFYFNQRFYKYLISKMEPKYGIWTNVKVVKLASYLNDKVKECTRMEDGYQDIVHNMKLVLCKHNVIVTPYDFYIFCWDYMPPLFQLKAVPMYPVCNHPPNIEIDPEPFKTIEL